MSENEINPDAAVLMQLNDQWQKIAAALVWKLARDGVELTWEDFAELTKATESGEAVLFTHGQTESILLKFVTEEEALKLAEHDRKTNRGSA